VSLAALALTTVPFLRSIGLAAMLIPLISLLVSVTLLPVVLDGRGPRRHPGPRRPRRRSRPGHMDTRRAAQRRRLAAADPSTAAGKAALSRIRASAAVVPGRASAVPRPRTPTSSPPCTAGT